jgi:NAD(P)-dependent dehydrogenase (short-subunit alcohol dehydrogenase family)
MIMAKQTWFITGINSGFGRQMTEQLLATGKRVAGTVRKDGSVDDLVKRYTDQLWIGQPRRDRHPRGPRCR